MTDTAAAPANPVVTPAHGGTKKKPKNANLSVAFTVNKESHKTLSTITYFVPKNEMILPSDAKWRSSRPPHDRRPTSPPLPVNHALRGFRIAFALHRNLGSGVPEIANLLSR